MASWGVFDQLLFAVLPYLVFFIFFYVTIQRYRQTEFTYSSLSSQFLENRQHFWGLVPFHYGVLAVLAGHVMLSCFPANYCSGTAFRSGCTFWKSRR